LTGATPDRIVAIMGAKAQASIVVGADGSPSATEAVRHAAQLAKSQGALLHVVAAAAGQQGLAQAREALQRTADAVQEVAVAAEYHRVIGSPAETLATLAERVGARFIVVGNRGPQSLVPWRRPIAEQVERRANCPVVVVDTEPYWTARTGLSAARPPRLKREWQVLLITMVAVFLAFLDVTIVNVAFPDIQRDFSHTPLSDLSWVLNGYNVLFAALLVPAGRLADRHGRRSVFYGGVYLFLIGSTLCAVAPNVDLLVAARLLQSVGAAALIPTSLGLLLPEFAPERRSMAVSLWAAAGAVAAAAGPSLGGVLVDVGGWRWAFIVNLSALAVLPVARRVLVERRDPQATTAPDGTGGLLLAVSVGLLALGIVKAPDWGWTSGPVWLCWLGCAALLALLLVRSKRHPSPVLEPELLSIRSFRAASVTMLVYSAGFYALLLCNILFLTEVWHYSILRAGFAVTPGPIAAAIGAAVAGRIAEHRGPRNVVVLAAVGTAVALTLYRTLPGAQPNFLADWLPCQLVSGTAAGMVFAALSTATVMDLPGNRIATGTALASCLRQIGAVLGVATLIAVLGTPSPTQLLSPFHDAYGLMIVAAVGAAFAGTRLPARHPDALADAAPLRDVAVPREIPGLETHETTLHGGRVVYRTAGEGQPIVLIHGLLDSGATWRKVAPILAVNHRVIVPDLLGHGDSDGPAGADYSVFSHALLIRDLMDELGIERATVVGHSLGAGVAMGLAYACPERVERLAVLSAGGLGPDLTLTLRAAAFPGADWLARALGSRICVRALLGVAWLSSSLGARRFARGVLEMARMLEGLADAGRRAAFLESARAVINLKGQRSSALRLLPAYRMPLFVLWGTRDRVIPARHAEQVTAIRPDTHVVLLDGVGHSPHLVQPTYVAQALSDWITGDVAPPRHRPRPRPAAARSPAAVTPTHPEASRLAPLHAS
jgi:EmrB/QacA subfamily drug resistance transporter